MDKRYVIIADHGFGPVYLCNGGGSFQWWTPHKSMASKVGKARALELVGKRGGKAYEVRMG